MEFSTPARLEALMIPLYSQPWRVYHDWTHIQRGIHYQYKLVEQSPISTSMDFSSIRFAWYMHDAVYIPGCPDNEKLSADLVPYYARLVGVKSASFMTMVQAMIMATKTHTISQELKDLDENAELFTGILLDTDLMELSNERYTENMYAVEEEFRRVLTPAIDKAPSLAFQSMWREGRKKWLRSMLDREFIFHTKFAKPFDAKAFANLEHELKFMERS